MWGSLLGAGAGYLADKATGGKGKYGALAGGLLGGGFNMNNGVGYDFGDSLLGQGVDYASGLFGGAQAKPSAGAYTGLDGSTVNLNADQLASVKSGNYVSGVSDATTSHMPSGSFNQALPSTYNKSGGLWDSLSNYDYAGLSDKVSGFKDKYGDTIDLGMDAFNTYGDYQTQQDARKKNEAEYNYINDMRRRANAEQAYMTNARNQAQSNIGAGYQGSSLSNYYTT